MVVIFLLIFLGLNLDIYTYHATHNMANSVASGNLLSYQYLSTRGLVEVVISFAINWYLPWSVFRDLHTCI